MDFLLKIFKIIAYPAALYFEMRSLIMGKRTSPNLPGMMGISEIIGVL